MTLAQKLDELEKEIQNFEIIEYDRDIHFLSQKLQRIKELMDLRNVHNYLFKIFTRTLPLKYIKNCIKKCEVNYRTEKHRSKNVAEIKHLVKAANHWFKEGCQWYEINVLNKERKFLDTKFMK